MRARSKSFATLALLAAGACAPAVSAGGAAASAASPPSAKNVILIVGDGTGLAYWSAAKFATDSLAVATMPVIGLVDTRSSDHYVTDSAAGATVYATGARTYNGAIGVGPACKERFAADSVAVMRDPASCAPLETVVEVAERQGMSTGLVATSAITHATPASFAAHVPYRRMQPEIAAQLAASGVDVMLGGGRGFFDGSLRPDSADLLAPLCREAACPASAAELAALRPDGGRLVGLFARNQPGAAPSRSPSLPEMTRAALAWLAPDPQGFFLLVEGSQPDWRGHENASLDSLTAEVLDLDRAVGVALEFARQNPETLVVVTADHETGGLALHEEEGALRAGYTTDYHTGEMVPLFAFGPGAQRFGRVLENAEVGKLLLEAVRTVP